MEYDLMTVLTQSASISIIVLALVQFTKSYLPKKFVPLSALVSGIVLSLLWFYWITAFPLNVSIFIGLIAGLTAGGFYEQKAIVK